MSSRVWYVDRTVKGRSSEWIKLKSGKDTEGEVGRGETSRNLWCVHFICGMMEMHWSVCREVKWLDYLLKESSDYCVESRLEWAGWKLTEQWGATALIPMRKNDGGNKAVSRSRELRMHIEGTANQTCWWTRCGGREGDKSILWFGDWATTSGWCI